MIYNQTKLSILLLLISFYTVIKTSSFLKGYYGKSNLSNIGFGGGRMPLTDATEREWTDVIKRALAEIELAKQKALDEQRALAEIELAKQKALDEQRALAEAKPLKHIDIPSLQQQSDEEWTYKGRKIEEKGNTIVDTPGLLWKNVRMEDGEHCGMHVLKNINLIVIDWLNNFDINKALESHSSRLRTALLNKSHLISYINQWAPLVYNKRKSFIEGRASFISKDVTDYRVHAKAANLAKISNVDKNDGHIKVSYLEAQEIESIVTLEMPELSNHIIIIEYDPESAVLSDDKKDKLMLSLGIKELTLNRIIKFKEAKDDILGFALTEKEFNHWITCIAIKKDYKTFIYFMNSITSKKPKLGVDKFILDILRPNKLI